MNTETIDRIMMAAVYQKKAIHALLPEEMKGHLEVIEKELKMMAGEALQALLCDIYVCRSAEKKYHDNGRSTNSDMQGACNENRKNAAESGGDGSGGNEAVSEEFRHIHDTRKIDIV